MNKELVNAVEFIHKEKNIPMEVLVDAIEAALITAYKKNYQEHKNVSIDLNLENGSYRVISRKDVWKKLKIQLQK